MGDFKQECNLCDNIVRDKNFKAIDDVAKYIFDGLLLKLTLNETQKVMCTTCSSKLMAASNFKKKCLYTDKTIIPYVSMLDDREVCRLCLQPVSGDHKSIQEVPVSTIQIYIPEINFGATTNPVICIKCYDGLRVHSTFIKNCVNVDKRRNGNAKNCGEMFLNVQSLKAEEIEIKSEETGEELISEPLCETKKEEQDEGDTPLQSQSDSMHTEGSKSLYDLDDREPTTVANYQSEECSFKSPSESRSAGHGRRYKKASEAQMNKSDGSKRNSKLRCPTRGLKVQEYQCDECPYNTKRKHNFMQHQLIHKNPSEVQMYKCNQCLYRSIRKDHLKRHRLRQHKDPSEVKMFICDQCTFQAKEKSNLIKHCRTHKDPAEVRVFQCDECDYKGTQKYSLKKHQLRHKDPAQMTMFKCDKCTYESKHKKSLITHFWTHKDPSEVQMFECGECYYRTIYKSSLKQHQLIHKDTSEIQMFKCDECNYKSNRKHNVKQHQWRHKGSSRLRVFNCDKCDYKCIEKNILKKHQLCHKDPSEVQVFQCAECGYKSIRKYQLKRHLLRHKDPSKVRMFQCNECDHKCIEKNDLKRHQLTYKDPSEVRVFTVMNVIIKVYKKAI